MLGGYAVTDQNVAKIRTKRRNRNEKGRGGGDTIGIDITWGRQREKEKGQLLGKKEWVREGQTIDKTGGGGRSTSRA